MRRNKRMVLVLLVVTFLLGYWRLHASFDVNPMDEIKPLKDPSNLHVRPTSKSESQKTPKQIKVYIYKLPEKFNLDIMKCVSVDSCFDLSDGGLGSLLYREGEMQVHNTHQFSLEVLLHNQLHHSKYFTNDPHEADIFYIPAYFGIEYFCRQKAQDIRQLVEGMFDYVKSMPYFGQGKPHLSALSRIEKELVQDMHPVLQNNNYRNITCIVIEKMTSETRIRQHGMENQRVIVAPYPSYVHLNPRHAAEQTIPSPTLTSRQIFMFIASSDRRVNVFRNVIVDQFQNKIHDISFQEFKNPNNVKSAGEPLQIWLVTQECVGQQENFTINWMQNSVFCLQPHGDSPTRKSFYDSILSGCIPVIFKFRNEKVEYPFERVLNYSDFVVTIDSQKILTNKELVVDILKTIPMPEIERLYKNVLLVARKLQYSVLVHQDEGYEDSSYVDALDLIVDEAAHVFGLRF